MEKTFKVGDAVQVVADDYTGLATIAELRPMHHLVIRADGGGWPGDDEDYDGTLDPSKYYWFVHENDMYVLQHLS